MAIEDDIRKLLNTPFPLHDLVTRALGDAHERTGGHAEREARHELEGAMISGLADALEARHRAEEHREALEESLSDRAGKGFKDGDDAHGIAYDYAAFGMHTVKTFLELNARANRKVIEALRKTANARGVREDRREPREQPAMPVKLQITHQPLAGRPSGSWGEVAHRVGEFELVNRRGGRLGIAFPNDTVRLTSLSGGALPYDLPLVFVPRALDIEPGATECVRVETTAAASSEFLTHASGDEIWHGEVPFELLHGRHAPLSIIVRIPTARPVPLAPRTDHARVTLFTATPEPEQVGEPETLGEDGRLPASFYEGRYGLYIAKIEVEGQPDAYLLLALTGEVPGDDSYRQDVRQSTL